MGPVGRCHQRGARRRADRWTPEGGTGVSDSPIERYLDELFIEVRAMEPRAARSLLSEAESHLWDAAGEAEQGGTGRLDAEEAAVRRFGGAPRIAAEDRHREVNLVRSVVVSAWS